MPDDPILSVFAYRAFDLRDHFPQPLETFCDALECLQSENAYLPNMTGEIVAYLRDGKALTIPDEFFLRRLDGDVALVHPQENDVVCDSVEKWLQETLSQLQPMTEAYTASSAYPRRFELTS